MAANRMEAGAQQARHKRPWLKWLNRAVTVGFIALVAWLIASRAGSVDWHKVLQSLREMPNGRLALAAAFAAASYAIYACFDWFARIYTTQVPKLRQFEIALVSYAFNLNLGALIGSVGFRYRLYSRSGVDARNIARIVATSMVTNWSGYFLLGGIVFACRCVALPQGWEIGAVGLQLIGGAMLLLVAAYLLLCARSHGKVWTFRKTEFSLPSLRIACGQIVASSLNWLAIAATIRVLLPDSVGFGAVLAVFLLSSVAGAMTHVPGGLGVLEAVFIALLGGDVAAHRLLAALLAFRAFYYLGPLVIAIGLYVWIEWRGRRGGARKRRQAHADARRGQAAPRTRLSDEALSRAP
ncbi:lysylphosphatidylglycerol synthase domain-containing protein [Solimonas terrae]|uniref:UPF0104 family protein n=1 Tax=Solimonas terrae TaxID=1396819 RepID=A0A6M2BSI0_9GAMM|nr:lysylphosphatidylglycerol synthase domain-containing protein [Solimonas terrae]NGY05171.1 UPF0104 family protein [Solimonas terrae]